MEELIIKMLICLLIALALGFLFGWLLKRAFTKEKYSPIIDKLEADLTQSKEALKIREEETMLIKEQFMHAQNELETSSLKITEFEDKFHDYNAKLSMFESNIEEREARIQEEQKQKSFFQTQLDDKQHEFEKLVQESASQNEMINRLKEHHVLLKNELTKVKESKYSKEQELEKYSIMIEQYKENEIKLQDEKKIQEAKLEELKSSLNEKNLVAVELENKVKKSENINIEIAKYKENEIKLLDEKKAKEGKLVELESILNEKKIAAIELRNKVKEMDTLKQKNSALTETIKQIETDFKEAQEKVHAYENSIKNLKNNSLKEDEKGLFNKPEEATTTQIQDEKSIQEGFGWVKFAKKALHYVSDASEEINKNADKVIKEYKNR